MIIWQEFLRTWNTEYTSWNLRKNFSKLFIGLQNLTTQFGIMENQNVRKKLKKEADNNEENARKKRVGVKIPKFRCPAGICKRICDKDNVETHLIYSHQATACSRTPVENTISWQVNLIPEGFGNIHLCTVTEWGLFFLREIRYKCKDGIFSRMYVQYLDPVQKASHFQYDLELRMSENKSVSITGDVEHLFVPISQVKSSFTMNHGDVVSAQDFSGTSLTITIRKKIYESGGT